MLIFMSVAFGFYITTSTMDVLQHVLPPDFVTVHVEVTI